MCVHSLLFFVCVCVSLFGSLKTRHTTLHCTHLHPTKPYQEKGQEAMATIKDHMVVQPDGTLLAMPPAIPLTLEELGRMAVRK